MRWLEEIGSGDLAKNRELIAASDKNPLFRMPPDILKGEEGAEPCGPTWGG